MLMLRLGCAALLAWIGYIHLHAWQGGCRQIRTDGRSSCSTRWPGLPWLSRCWRNPSDRDAHPAGGARPLSGVAVRRPVGSGRTDLRGGRPADAGSRGAA